MCSDIELGPKYNITFVISFFLYFIHFKLLFFDAHHAIDGMDSSSPIGNNSFIVLQLEIRKINPLSFLAFDNTNNTNSNNSNIFFILVNNNNNEKKLLL